MAGQLQQLGWALFNHAATGKDVLAYDKKAARWTYANGLLETLVKAGQVNEATLKDPFGRKLTLEGMAKVEKNFESGELAAMGEQMETMFEELVREEPRRSVPGETGEAAPLG